jgi:hypothetical protein
MPTKQSSLGPHALHPQSAGAAVNLLPSAARAGSRTIVVATLLALTCLHLQAFAQSGDDTPSHKEIAQTSSSTAGSAYIPVDSWIYTAALRLYYLGYLPTAYLDLRPWTRASLAHMLELSQDALNSSYAPPEAIELNERLRRELLPELMHQTGPSIRSASVYTRGREISGSIFDDSFHLGQTIINDYGRPDQPGFNNLSGFSVEAEAGRFSLYVRAEYQHAPSAPGYSASVASQLASVDLTPDVPQPTIPLGPIAGQDTTQIMEANLSMHALGHEISFGRSDQWQGPGLGASMGWSNNAQDIYGFRINRVEPLYIPGLSRIVGLFRYDFVVGALRGHTFPSNPWIHMEKVSMKVTPDFEVGFMRDVIWGGHEDPCIEGSYQGNSCTVPITVGSFLRSFFSVTAPQPAVKFSTKNPGARFSTFDLTWRVPLDNHLVTVYLDSFAHDNLFPISNLGRSGVRPGFYVARLPGLPRVDFRAEGGTTNVHDPESIGGRLLMWESVDVQGYTNKGYILGDWLGRESTGGQAWITWHMKPDQQIQLQYRQSKAATDFIPGGTTQNDISADAVLRPLRDLEIKASAQGELWRAPILSPGTHHDVVGTIQLTYYPHIK